MISETKRKILELLTKKPRHGYGLKKELKVSLSSIYKHLKELNEKGFIETLKEENSRIYYQITTKGRMLLSLIK